MSATMATQRGWDLLDQYDICLALSMAPLAHGGYVGAAIEAMQHLVKYRREDV
jgi:hypothetical protein